MTAARPVLGAIAVVLDGTRVLLAQRRNPPDAGLWGFPGGHVERGETALAAAARELHEETGVIAEPLEYLTNIDVIQTDAEDEIVAHYLLAVVLCRYVSGRPVAADDVQEAAWTDIASLPDPARPTSARVVELVAMAQDRLASLRRPPSA